MQEVNTQVDRIEHTDDIFKVHHWLVCIRQRIMVCYHFLLFFISGESQICIEYTFIQIH